MRLEDLIAMEVPKPVLQFVAKENEIKPKGAGAEDYAVALVNSEKTKGTAEVLASEYRFAGRTAVNIFTPLSGIDQEWNKKEYFIKRLAQKYSPEVFNNGLRPQLSEKPQLVNAFNRENSVVLAFTYLGKAQRQLIDYEIVKRSPQLLDYTVVHFNPFSIEIRAPFMKEKMFKTAVLETMDVDPSKVEWDMVTRLSDKEAQSLAEVLGAVLIGAKHKMNEGIYDTKEVKANPEINLFEQDEYIREFAGLPCKKQTLCFQYRYSFGLPGEISFRITDTGLNFISDIPEEVITLVVQEILKIRADDIRQIVAK